MNYGDFSNPKGGYSNLNATPTYATSIPMHESEPKYNNGSIIFFVNGHWNDWNGENISPSKGGIYYWKFFNPGGLFANFLDAAYKYFSIKSLVDFKFIDGSSLFAADQSGQDRKEIGYQYAKSYFEKYKSKLVTNTVHFVSHSEGCAYGIGMAKYFNENGIAVKESVLLACDEGDEFVIDFLHESYQIELMYWNKEENVTPIKTSKILKTYYSPHFDYIINTSLKSGGVKGITKFGVISLGIFKNGTSKPIVHGGSIVDASSFRKITALKDLHIEQVTTSNGSKLFRQLDYLDVKFYQFNKSVIDDNNPNYGS